MGSLQRRNGWFPITEGSKQTMKHDYCLSFSLIQKIKITLSPDCVIHLFLIRFALGPNNANYKIILSKKYRPEIQHILSQF